MAVGEVAPPRLRGERVNKLRGEEVEPGLTGDKVRLPGLLVLDRLLVLPVRWCWWLMMMRSEMIRKAGR